MATKVGKQDGITAEYNRLRDMDPDGTLLVKGKDGKWPDMWAALATVPVADWKAWDKGQRTKQLLKNDHDAAIGGGSNPSPGPEPDDQLETVRARIFLAEAPLDSLKAPAWMTPVCTADHAYRHEYTPDTIDRLGSYFGSVEAWCDCRAEEGTAYEEALRMVDELGLDGAWGQCETQAEFDHAYTSGARRMIGNLSVLDQTSLDLIAGGQVLLTVELYRNVQPWQQPDWKNCNNGIGGNTIACYESVTEGATYMPVAQYRADGLYVPKADSVYGVGLREQDWKDLA
jgi:hypothetical protein